MVKPADLHNNLLKTQHLEKIQKLHKSTPEEAQKHFAQELSKKIADGKTKTANLPKADEIIVHRKKNKKERNKRKAGQRKKNKQYDKDAAVKKINYIA